MYYIRMFRICTTFSSYVHFFFIQKYFSQKRRAELITLSVQYFRAFTGSQTMPIWQSIFSDYTKGMHEA